MSDPDRSENRFVALETRLAYQDEAIESLNAALTAQWTKIDALAKQLADLGNRLREAEVAEVRGEPEMPPHY